MITIKAFYKQGKIEFLEPSPDIAQALVTIVFMETETMDDALTSLPELVEGN